MTVFDAELVGRWFHLLLHPERSGDELFSVRPDRAEQKVLENGRAAITAAVGWSALPASAPAPADPAAALLQTYLTGMATGIAGARRAILDGPEVDQASAGDRLCLVAGLIAGGAAIQVTPDDGLSPAVGYPDRAGGTAVDVATTAGTTAAELVVNDADLHAITSAAAASVLAAGPPDTANRDSRYRARALVGAVLVALHRSTAPVRPPVSPPSCGAGPGTNTAAGFLAEVTFTMFCSEEDTDRLRAVLAGLSDEVVVWSEGDRRYFHVHTEAAGEVIAEAYAAGSVFSLTIGRLP